MSAHILERVDLGILRPIRMGDLEAIVRIYDRQKEQLTAKLWANLPEAERPSMEMPNPGEPHVFQVAVGERDGEMLGAAFYEAEVEVMVVADNPDFMRLFRKHQASQEYSLKIRNYKTMRCFVPKGLGQVGAMKRRGFTHMNQDWDCFVKAL